MSWIASTAYGAIGGAIAGSGEGFQPYPNSIMPPFMSYQSAMMAYDFGLNYEMGKRTIKSLPSDLFNRIRSGDPTPVQVTYAGQEYTIPTYQLLDFWQKKRNQEMLTQFRERLPDHSEMLRNDIIPAMVDIEFEKAKIKPVMYVKIIDAVIAGIRELRDAGATEDNLLNFLLDFFFGGSYWSTNPIDLTQPTTTEPPPEPPLTFESFLTDPLADIPMSLSWPNACTQQTSNQSISARPLGNHVRGVEAWITDWTTTSTCEEDTKLFAIAAWKNQIETVYGHTYEVCKKFVQDNNL